ncbi:MAG: PAS domain-containing protein [Bacteroidia bacterium]|nr:PAS domain-containing protein [Bacteroidia bacterium]
MQKKKTYKEKTVNRKRNLPVKKNSQESESSLYSKDLLDIAPYGYHSLDANKIFIEVNQTELNWLGYTREEMIGKMKLSDVVDDGTKKELKNNFQKLLLTGKIKNIEWNFIRKNGSILPVLVNAVGIFDSKNKLISTQTILFDNTERKKMEEELTSKILQLSEAQKLSRVGSWEANLLTGVTVWSDELFKICGVTPENVIPSFESFLNCLHPDDSHKVSVLRDIAMEEQHPLNSILRVIRPDGSVRIIDCKTNLYTDKKGNPLRMAGTCHDITEANSTDKKNTPNKTDYDIFVRVSGELLKVNTQDIVYVEVLGDYLNIHTILKKYTVHATMKNIEAKLPLGIFMRIHQSFIVRLDKISSIKENGVSINNKVIPVSRANWKELMERVKVV